MGNGLDMTPLTELENPAEELSGEVSDMHRTKSQEGRQLLACLRTERVEFDV